MRLGRGQCFGGGSVGDTSIKAVDNGVVDGSCDAFAGLPLASVLLLTQK